MKYRFFPEKYFGYSDDKIYFNMNYINPQQHYSKRWCKILFVPSERR